MLSLLRALITPRILIGIPIAAAVVHLLATFMAMSDTGNAAYTRVSRAFPVNAMSRMAADVPGQQTLPFLPPDAVYAVCPFDTSSGPIAVRAALPDGGWTIGVYRADGTSAYFAAAAANRETKIALTIVPQDDRFMGLTPQALGKPVTADPQMAVTARNGMVIVRGPDRGAAYRAATQKVLEQASCAPGRA